MEKTFHVFRKLAKIKVFKELRVHSFRYISKALNNYTANKMIKLVQLCQKVNYDDAQELDKTSFQEKFELVIIDIQNKVLC